MKILIALIVTLTLLLQYKWWFSDVGKVRAQQLADEIHEQQAEIEKQSQRNRVLTAQVRAFKSGDAAVESRARTDLGMIKSGEDFFLLHSEAARPTELERKSTAGRP